jgi:hypothetical protein
MNNGITDEQATLWLQNIAEGDPILHKDQTVTYTGSWISLHYDIPTLGGIERSELSGGGYLRHKMAWSVPADRTIWSLQDARFNGLMQTKVVYFGIWNLANLGFMRAYGELPQPQTILNGNGYILHAGTLAISF